MSSSNENNEPKNASGLIVSQSKALKERTVELNEEKIICAIKEVRCCLFTESAESLNE